MICEQCEIRFEPTPQDLDFYTKLHVPTPTFCPHCRLKRRMRQYVNVLSKRIYKQTCSATGKEIYTMYPPSAPFPIYNREYWYSDAWDATSYGKDYDFSVPFFEQLHQLRLQVPRFNTWNINSENCDYCVTILDSKDCYMSAGLALVNTYYSAGIENRDCFDCWYNKSTELCYEGIFSTDCYECHYTAYSTQCRESWFLYDCLNCSSCFGCFGLKNKQYYIFNQPYSKQEYEQKISQHKASAESVEAFRQEWFRFKQSQPHRFANLYNAEETTGNDNNFTKNCLECYEVVEAENCKHVTIAAQISDCMDCFDVSLQSSRCYESIASVNCYNLLSSIWMTNSHDVMYSDLCDNVSNVFGCVGLRGNQYCILNKQYTKEEYERLVPKIIEHMKQQPYVDEQKRSYSFGEFIPEELSLFAYNDSVAQEYFPLSADQAKTQHIPWKDEASKMDQATISASELPSDITQVNSSICREVIGCQHAGSCLDGCLQVFKILPQELAFYQKQHIPLPKLCPQCRHFNRARQKNPLHLWSRICMCDGKRWTGHTHAGKPCEVRFETSYAPERQEVVVCGDCYRDTFR